MKAARWGDADRYFGPFTWSYGTYAHWAIVLRSRGEEGGDGGHCTLRLSLGKATLIAVLPPIVRPWRKKVHANWDVATVERLGRDWYWNVDPREYGVSLSEGGFVSVYYGRQTHDSSTEQRAGYFLPWTQWRHVRRSLYGLKGELFETVPEKAEYAVWKLLEESCPHARFSCEDFDGKPIVATTRLEEREWHAGTGWFRWLSWFRRRKIHRSLDIEFSDEVGPEKGSWKGGTIGTSIEVLPGELHEAAFRRFCDQEHRAKGRRYRIKFLMPVGA